MKRTLILVCLMLLVGCTNKNSQTHTIKVMAPYGAPSIVLMDQIKTKPDSVTLVGGTDVILAELVCEDMEYDLIIAPINMGLSLISKGQSKTKLLAVVSWGNLYVVGKQGVLNDSNNTIAMFGKDAVPEKVANFTFDLQEIKAHQEYFASVLDAQAQLLTNKVQAAMLAEPFVSKTLLDHPDLEIIKDLQEDYQGITGLQNYPQAALFVNKQAYDKNPKMYLDYVDALAGYLKSINNNRTILSDDLNAVGTKTLGLPESVIVDKAFDRMNLDVVFAKDRKPEISKFMELFKLEVTDQMMVETQ